MNRKPAFGQSDHFLRMVDDQNRSWGAPLLGALVPFGRKCGPASGPLHLSTASLRPNVRALLLFALLGTPLFAATPARGPERWAAEIDKLTQSDASQPVAPDGIVFVGSSSMKRWQTLAHDFPGLPVLNRGFGGSQLADSVFYAERIIIPYRPRTVVLYAGENDINAGKTPETVLADFRAFVRKIHAELPQARIIYVGMKPSPSRWKHRDAFVRGNQLIADECARNSRLAFVDTWKPMLDSKGEPRPELFVKDMLHMNEKGYAIWTQILSPMLR